MTNFIFKITNKISVRINHHIENLSSLTIPGIIANSLPTKTVEQRTLSNAHNPHFGGKHTTSQLYLKHFASFVIDDVRAQG